MKRDIKIELSCNLFLINFVSALPFSIVCISLCIKKFSLKKHSMINKVILVGNVGADPEVRYISEDLPTARISLATSETYTDSKSGQRVTKTEWHSITAWRQLAKFAEQYIKKGAQLYVEGKLSYRSYEKDGVTKYTTDIIANEIRLLGKKEGGSESTYTPPAQAAPASQASAPAAPVFDAPAPTDDLPF
ncbi:MAG: single-stranded DNA-binding protein [Bacteroidales bacterium]|jgi:single-strand DNA-binding protein|nr:single-stranded DNA-binding protein [Bacteroidales bacterium]